MVGSGNGNVYADPIEATAEQMESWTPKMLDICGRYSKQDPPYLTTRKFFTERCNQSTFEDWRSKKAGFKSHLRFMEERFGITEEYLRSFWLRNNKLYEVEDPKKEFLETFEKALLGSSSSGCHQSALRAAKWKFDDFVSALRTSKSFRKAYEKMVFPVDPSKLTLLGILALDSALILSLADRNSGATSNILKSCTERFAPKRAGRPNKNGGGSKSLEVSAVRAQKAQKAYESMLAGASN